MARTAAAITSAICVSILLGFVLTLRWFSRPGENRFDIGVRPDADREAPPSLPARKRPAQPPLPEVIPPPPDPESIPVPGEQSGEPTTESKHSRLPRLEDVPPP